MLCCCHDSMWHSSFYTFLKKKKKDFRDTKAEDKIHGPRNSTLVDASKLNPSAGNRRTSEDEEAGFRGDSALLSELLRYESQHVEAKGNGGMGGNEQRTMGSPCGQA